MRRVLIAGVVLALGAMAAVLVYGAASREGEYRRLIAQGEAAAADEQTYVAIEAFSGAMALRPEAMLPYLRRGEAYRRRGEFTSALRDLSRAVDLDPAAPHPREQLGDVRLALGAYAAAADHYAAFVRLDDRSPRVLYKLAVAQRGAGQTGNAIASLRRALQLDQRFAEAHYLLGVCLRETKQPATAIDELQRAVKIAPAMIAPREELAMLYRAFGRTDEELDQLASLAAIESGRAERHVALGLAYARARRMDLAVATLRAAAERFPQQPRVYAALGRVWLQPAELRDDDSALRKALEALTPIATSGGADSETLTLFGRALLASNDAVGAEQVLRQAAERFPVDPASFTLLASAAERNNHAPVARDALVKYVSLVGPRTEPRVLVALGDLSLRVDDPAGAATWYRRALATAPGDPTLEARLEEALAKSRRPTAK
jgi:tetratricopeptide (TPR) repeat protein